MLKAADKVGGKDKVKCNYCLGVYTMGTTRAKAHLAGQKGAGVAVCHAAPANVRALLVAEKQEQVRADEKKAVSSRLDALTRSTGYSRAGTSHESTFDVDEDEVELVDPAPAKRQRQTTLDESFSKNKKQDLDRAVADFFYSNGISFNVARSKHFKDMILAVSRAGCTYQPPGSERLRTSLLQDASARVVSHYLLACACWFLFFLL